MSTFNTETAYKPKGSVFFDDGRETRLLEWLHARPDLEQIRGDPAAVLAAIDEYGRSQAYLMNVGPAKGAIVTSTIAAAAPRTTVELGGYVGYSAVAFGAAVRAARPDGSGRYLSLERNAGFAAVARGVVALAGLQETVEVVTGPSGETLRRLRREGTLERIDVLFLDHYKPAYVQDLKLCEELGLVGVGSVVVADNCITPGNPVYLEYVRATPAQKLEMYEKAKKGNRNAGWDERIPERTRNQYLKSEGVTQVDVSIFGRPELEYESKMVESFEPTGEKDGVEVSKCVADRSVVHTSPRS